MSATDDPVFATWLGVDILYWYLAQYGENGPVATRIRRTQYQGTSWYADSCVSSQISRVLLSNPRCRRAPSLAIIKTSHIWSSYSNVIKLFLMRFCEEVLTGFGNVRSSYHLHWPCISMERRIYYGSNLVPPLTCILKRAYAL
jgi:hypothetical protein